MERMVLPVHFEFDQEAMGRFADAMRAAAAGSEDVLAYLFGECFGQLWDECVEFTECVRPFAGGAKYVIGFAIDDDYIRLRAASLAEEYGLLMSRLLHELRLRNSLGKMIDMGKYAKPLSIPDSPENVARAVLQEKQDLDSNFISDDVRRNLTDALHKSVLEFGAHRIGSNGKSFGDVLKHTHEVGT